MSSIHRTASSGKSGYARSSPSAIANPASELAVNVASVSRARCARPDFMELWYERRDQVRAHAPRHRAADERARIEGAGQPHPGSAARGSDLRGALRFSAGDRAEDRGGEEAQETLAIQERRRKALPRVPDGPAVRIEDGARRE